VDSILVQELMDHATYGSRDMMFRRRLSSLKVPTRWLVTPDADRIPMTATGKVDKAALRALLAAGEEGP
jgi:acyl-CoA synthetase (AMP-forming)/AMP-acid ligase II